MLKTVKVVMLPTEKASGLPCLRHDGIWEVSNIKLPYVKSDTFYHLYLVSDEEGGVGDFEYDFKKIIAATDKSMAVDALELTLKHVKGDFPHRLSKELPGIPQSFIEDYVKSNGEIEQVEVECKEVDPINTRRGVSMKRAANMAHDMIFPKLKLNDNKVIIHKSEEKIVNKLETNNEIEQLDPAEFNNKYLVSKINELVVMVNQLTKE